MKKFLIALAALAAFGAQAEVVSYGAADTDWSKVLTLHKFDSSLGTLNSVTFTYSGQVTSVFNVENLNPNGVNVRANSAADIIFGGPISTTLALQQSQTRAVSGFDGANDFGGTSGFGGLSVSTSGAGIYAVLAADLGLYAGLATDTFDITVDAFGNSSANGGGNLSAKIATQALAQIEVVYDYTTKTTPPSVPEPASLALVGLALAGVAASRRRKV